MRNVYYFLLSFFSFVACSVPTLPVVDNDFYTVNIFIPGQIQGSPPLESLVAGLYEAENNLGSNNLKISVLEAGFDQGEWDRQFEKMVNTVQANLYITTNPSMRGIVEKMAKRFPKKNFLIFETDPIDLPNVLSIDFKSDELAYLSGIFAASYLSEIYPNLTPYVGVLIGQEYPKMEAIILSFMSGFNSYAEETKISYRVLGNWYDAERARQLADQFYDSGVMGVFTIAGLANQGVVQSAKENDRYVMFYEASLNDPALLFNNTIFSGFIDYKNLCAFLINEGYNGSLPFGEHIIYGLEDSILGFLDSNDNLKEKLDKNRFVLGLALDSLENE